MKKFSIFLALAAFASINHASAYNRESKLYTHLDFGYGFQNLNQTMNDSTGLYSTNSYSVGSKGTGRGYIGAFGIGYYLLNELRLDVSVYYNSGLKLKKNGSSGSVQVGSKSEMSGLGLFFSGYYDVMTGSPVNPYIMLGAGVLRSQYKPRFTLASPLTGSTSYGGGKSITGFAYKFGVGLSYHFAGNFDLDLGYQFIHQGSLKSNKKNKRNIYEVDPMQGLMFLNKRNVTQVITVGVRYTF